MFVNPNRRMQFEAMSSQGQFLAVSSSKLGGNEWSGELRVFSNKAAAAEDEFKTFAATRLDHGSCANVMFQGFNVACAGDDGNVRLFALSREFGLSKTHDFAHHDDLVSCLAGNEVLLASGSWDRSCQVYDPSAGKSVKRIALEDTCAAVSFLDRFLLAVGETNGLVAVWDLRTDSCAYEYRLNSPTVLCSLAASQQQQQHGGKLFAGCGDGTVRSFDHVNQTQEVLFTRKSAVHALALCGETGNLLAGADDGSVTLHSPAIEVKQQHTDFVRGVAFWNGKAVSSSWDGMLRVF